MNKNRRKEIARALPLIEEAKSILEACRDDEQDYYDSLPENFQNSDRGETAQTAIDNLDLAVNSLDEAITETIEATQ